MYNLSGDWKVGDKSQNVYKADELKGGEIGTVEKVEPDGMTVRYPQGLYKHWQYREPRRVVEQADVACLKTGSELIAAERQRQIEVEGWTPAHDDGHVRGEMRDAALCYARNGLCAESLPPAEWPWYLAWWKPSSDEVRNWTKAGALFQAEGERLERMGHSPSSMRLCSEDIANQIDILRSERVAGE